jgi:hypothetical protein
VTTLDDVVEWGQTIDPPSQMAERGRAFGIDPVELLVDGARRSQTVYDAPPGPKSELAAARRLVEFYEVLRSLALLASRDSDGALLKEPATGFMALAAPPPLKPAAWQPGRPRKVEDIEPFPNVARWRRTIADADQRALGNRLGNARRKSTTSKRSQLQSMGRQVGGRSLIDLPFLLYYGNYGKVVSLVKTKEMTFTTEAGRIAILAYLIRVVCGDLKVYKDWTDSIGKNGEATAEQLAKAMLNSDFVGGEGSIMRLLFTAESSDAKLLEGLREHESMRILIEVSALKVISQFTDIRPDFLPAAQAEPKGCAAIKWMQELMRDVPYSYKMLWAVRKYEADRGLYRGNFRPGDWMPLGEFIPLDDEESKKRECLFLGTASGFADTILIMTEEGRILQIDERARDLQSFCTAVLSVAPFIAMSYVVAAVAGLVVAGELLPAVLGELLAGGARVAAPRLAAWEASGAVKWIDALIASRRWEAIVNSGLGVASITFNVQHAGGVTNYLKQLKSPLEAGLLLLDLLSIRGAFKADELAHLIEENRILAQQLERSSAQTKAVIQPAHGPTSGRQVLAVFRGAKSPVEEFGERGLPATREAPALPVKAPTGEPLVESRLSASAPPLSGNQASPALQAEAPSVAAISEGGMPTARESPSLPVKASAGEPLVESQVGSSAPPAFGSRSSSLHQAEKPSVAAVGERGVPAARDPAALPLKSRSVGEPLVESRLGSPARGETGEAQLIDELAPRRAARAAANESKATAAPMTMPPRREPIGETLPAPKVDAEPRMITAERTDDPIRIASPTNDIEAMRLKKGGGATRAEEQEAEQQAADEMVDELPDVQQLASGDLPRMGPKGPTRKGRGRRMPPPAVSARPARGGLVVLEGGADQARKETKFKSLLEMLRPFKKGATKRNLAHKYEAVESGFKVVQTEDCDARLIEAVAQARATEAVERAKENPFPQYSFEANFAAFKVTIDGKELILVARNTKEELHSEGWILKRLEAEVGPLKIPSNAARVKVTQIFTERAPCAGQCEIVISTYFKEAAVFFFVPKAGERWAGAAKTLREFWLGIRPLQW